MPKNMRAAFAREPGRVVVEEIAVPEPAPDEVLLQIRRCGICGSDLHWYHGGIPLPHVCPGHEISAVVADVGSAVRRVKPGDRVAVEGIRTCGRCAYCETSDYELCRNVGMIGMTVPGGFAEYLATTERHLFAIPGSVDDEVAQLTEPLAVSVHALRLAGLEMGQRVLVLGAGTIGLTAVAAARAGGAGEILVTARRPQQKAAALALGAARVFDPNDGELVSTCFDRPVDVVVETVGDAQQTLGDAVTCVRPGGTIAILGVFMQMPQLNALFVMMKEARIVGSLCYGRRGARADFDVALDILARDGEAMRRQMITHRFALDDIDAAFRAANDKASGSIKVSIAPA
ncbi:MAG TPA: alcohol dehydrogenase catalytic domain-containing protein [Candidatus Binatia bacterium]|nr:alcohol dehydrogenase catalytic domain-containing protein [Candidatus Binatia bacterium]